MENVTYLSSGALNRAHFALVTKQERGGRNEDEAVWETFGAVKARMTKPSSAGIAASIGNLFNVAGLHLQLPAAGWNSKQAREDLLLLLYCRQSLEGGSRKLSVNELLFALPNALTLAEAGLTIEERRVGIHARCIAATLGYLFCADVLPSDHEMQLLIVNTIRKDIESSNPARIILALDAIIVSPNHDVIPAVRHRLEVLSAHRSPYVRRRVLHAIRILSTFDQEILQDCKATLLLRLQDDNPTVKSAALALLQTCFQEQFDLKFMLGILTELIRHPKGKRQSSRAHILGVLTVRAVETLGELIPSIKEDATSVFGDLIKLAARAASQHTWGVLLACMRTVSHFPPAIVTSRLMQTLRDSPSSNHPLSFLSPLLRSTDINVTSVLLQSLSTLPVQTWAGGSIIADETLARAEPTGPSEADKGVAPVASSPLADIAEAELFGDEVDQGGWENAATATSAPKAETNFPALFTESEVGIIVGLLKSRDEAIRKLTLTLLARSDSSSDGLVNQYLGQLVSAASEYASPDAETPEDIMRRNSLVCQALQVAEVLSGDNGTAYATFVTDIILRSDNQRTRRAGVASPTLSSRSRTSTDTRASAKGRGGTMEKAIEIILTRARRGQAFFAVFSNHITQTLLAINADEPLSITFLVIGIATVCEVEDIDPDVSQQLLRKFSHCLLLTTPSVQETLLLVMLRLLSCLEQAPDEVLTTVADLKYHSGRHIQHRCLQFLERIKDIPALKKSTKDTSLGIPSLLRVLETTPPVFSSKTAPVESQRASTLPEESLLGLKTSSLPSKELRYQAYDTPSRTKRGPSHAPDMRTELLREKAPYFPESSQSRHRDASDLIELAGAIKVPETTSGGNGTRLEEEVESPFETNISTVLSDIQPPPFLSRTRTPIGSPPLSPRVFQRSPPVSPRMNTPPKGSPSFRHGRLSSSVDVRDAEVSFDIRFDRLGTQGKSTARGWFEGSMDDAIAKLGTLTFVESSVIHQKGDETKIQVKQGIQVGLLKLRQEEDHSTLWILRCSDPLLQRNVKEALL